MEDSQDDKLPSCLLLWAVIKRDAAIVKALLEAGANPEVPCKPRNSILTRVSRDPSSRCTKWRRRHRAVPSRSWDRCFTVNRRWLSRILYAGGLVKYPSVEYLDTIPCGADINIYDHFGNTVLHHAVGHSRRDSLCL